VKKGGSLDDRLGNSPYQGDAHPNPRDDQPERIFHDALPMLSALMCHLVSTALTAKLQKNPTTNKNAIKYMVVE
jgi:hypothetical protein